MDQAAHALRILCADAVEHAQHGHPGMPLGMADIMTVFWREIFRHHPNEVDWPNRDRFVLSNGHGSMLLYAAMHLSGYPLTLNDIKQFRQLHSLTPGHPEVGVTAGVDASTGPLGQGFAMAVGMAWAAEQTKAVFNRSDNQLFDHRVFAFVSDGDLMEGISHEAASLAGTWRLANLKVCYDANQISLDGPIDGWYTENVAERFRAYGWYVIDAIDGHDLAEIRAAFAQAEAEHNRPSLLIFKTIIGYGAGELANTAKSHGSALGGQAISALRLQLNWNHSPFTIPDDAYQLWDQRPRGELLYQAWQQRWQAYQQNDSDNANELQRRWAGQLPLSWPSCLDLIDDQTTLATRHSSRACLKHLTKMLPELVGGSADLSESNGTLWSGASVWQAKDNPAGQYCHFGVREFAMSAWANGVSLYGLHRPMVATFLVFHDYARSAVRLSALMKQPVVYVYSHDSLAIGADGPTHQPVEQLASLRLIPHMEVWRPADSLETKVAWQQILERRSGPASLILSRQKLPALGDRKTEHMAKGGYIVQAEQGDLELIIITSGSEVSLVLDAVSACQKQGIRVISMPCIERFSAQSDTYQEAILPKHCFRRLAVEAAHPSTWWRWVGSSGRIIGVSEFGHSGDGAAVMALQGFSVSHVASVIMQMLSSAEETNHQTKETNQ